MKKLIMLAVVVGLLVTGCVFDRSSIRPGEEGSETNTREEPWGVHGY